MAVHEHQPQVFHHTFGAHEPVITVSSGDLIRTTTLDAAGRDARDEPIAEPGNPLTGPFFVSCARPGDTLVVHVRLVRPNRRRGFSSPTLAPGTVEPEFVRELEATRRRIDWDIDLATGTARPREPLVSLAGLTVPLMPMLGCIGVAPGRGQRLSAVTSGQHGGNMDYRRIGAGVTLRFPVFVPGALLFVGDAHAAQGAGELTGTGVEVSADVELEVSVEHPDDPEKRARWPRGETAREIFTLGNARPLDGAAQHATSEMLRWLRSDYGLSTEAASILIGQTCGYELGNMFDPAYTMVCVIEKRYLPA